MKPAKLITDNGRLIDSAGYVLTTGVQVLAWDDGCVVIGSTLHRPRDIRLADGAIESLAFGWRVTWEAAR